MAETTTHVTHAAAVGGAAVLVSQISDVIQHGVHGAPDSVAALGVAGASAIYAAAVSFIRWKWPNALPPNNNNP